MVIEHSFMNYSYTANIYIYIYIYVYKCLNIVICIANAYTVFPRITALGDYCWTGDLI